VIDGENVLDQVAERSLVPALFGNTRRLELRTDLFQYHRGVEPLLVADLPEGSAPTTAVVDPVPGEDPCCQRVLRGQLTDRGFDVDGHVLPPVGFRIRVIVDLSK
jgi:hypothetical protein